MIYIRIENLLLSNMSLDGNLLLLVTTICIILRIILIENFLKFFYLLKSIFACRSINSTEISPSLVFRRRWCFAVVGVAFPPTTDDLLDHCPDRVTRCSLTRTRAIDDKSEEQYCFPR